ncbi:hypothetical protein D3C72_1524190 [compost metagenome]
MTGRFTSGPSRAVPPNSATASGNSATLATPCPARAPRSIAANPFGRPCGRHHNNHRTPPKLSQKPADSTDSGAGSNIASAASAKPCATVTGRRTTRARATTAIINAVRTVGSSLPATTA